MKDWVIGEWQAFKTEDINYITMESSETGDWKVIAVMKDQVLNTLHRGAYQLCRDFMDNLNGDKE